MNNFREKVSFIWSVADLLRGPYRPNQYKGMLPMTVLRRLDCVSAHGTKCLRTEICKSVNVFLPSLAEQADICVQLERKSDQIALLVDRIDLSIDRLREYRTALISAVVTGSIDVGSEVVP